MKETILFISPNFPPLNTSASISNAYYCMELEKLGYDVIILTAEIPQDHVQYRQNTWFQGQFKEYRTDLGLYKKFYARQSIGHGGLTPSRRSNQFLKKIVKKVLLYPDAFVYWSRTALDVANQIIEEHHPSIIITASEPNSAHLLGYKLKNKYPSIEWIGYFGDPWSLEPTLSSFEQWAHRFLETKVIKGMDRFCFTTDNTRNLYCTEFNLNREITSVYSRGYDPKLFQIENRISLKEDKMNIVYTGAIGMHRNMSYFLEAIIEMEEELRSKVQFYFVGKISQDLEEVFQHYDFISLPGFVSFEEALMYAQAADFLFLLDNQQTLQLPAKAFEYVGTSTPIITLLTNETSPLCKMMKEVNRGLLIFNTNKGNIVDGLRKAISLYEKDQIPHQWCVPSEQYNIRNVVRDFACANLHYSL